MTASVTINPSGEPSWPAPDVVWLNRIGDAATHLAEEDRAVAHASEGPPGSALVWC